LKPLIALFLVVMLSWQMLFKTGFIVYWKLNQAYITQKLCVNKAKPTMHCNGKCYLMKQLKTVETPNEGTKNIPSTILKLKTSNPFILSKHYYNLKEAALWNNHDPLWFSGFFLLSKGFLNSIDHPPEFS
jgi:hypothetical protein